VAGGLLVAISRLSLLLKSNRIVAHRDAGGWEPSTASQAEKVPWLVIKDNLPRMGTKDNPDVSAVTEVRLIVVSMASTSLEIRVGVASTSTIATSRKSGVL
jgi:hypothetical protein